MKSNSLLLLLLLLLLELFMELTIFETKNNVEIYIYSDEMQWYCNVTTVGVQHVSSTVGSVLKGEVCRRKFMFLIYIVELMPQSKRKKTAVSDSRNLVHVYLFLFIYVYLFFLSLRQYIKTLLSARMYV